MVKLPQGTLKVKATMVTNDGGRTFVITHRHYVVDVRTDQYLDIEMIGTRLAMIQENEDAEHTKQV